MIVFSSSIFGCSVVPSITGTFGPYTSASSSPTDAPIFFSAIARFTAIVVLPTPPLPLATAIRFFTPSIAALPCGRTPSGTDASNFKSMVVTPATFASAARTSFSIVSRCERAGVVSLTSSDTVPSRTSTFFVNPSVTRSLWSSGSMTPRSASTTAASVGPLAISFLSYGRTASQPRHFAGKSQNPCHSANISRRKIRRA